MSTDRSITPKKTVRFEIDKIDPKDQSPNATSASATSSTTSVTSKKTVRFAIEDDAAPTTLSHDATSPSTQHPPPFTEAMTLLDTSTTLATPMDGQPPSSANVSQSSSVSSSSGTCGQSESSTLWPTDVKDWTETGTIPSTTLQSSSSPSNTPNKNPTTLSTPAFESSPKGVEVIQVDEGEKDATGKVIEAIHEPCEKCGGKVIWATKGEWLLICEGCQEPQ